MAVVVLATACAIAHTCQSKVIPNTNVIHTPPPTGNLPEFFKENKDTGRKK
jgi:hypothetical protein